MSQIVKQIQDAVANSLSRGEIEELPLKYLKRKKYFQNYKNSCGFDPETGDGHSYHWYELSKVIRGKLVLNTYSYSNQTAKHVSKFRRLFNALNLSYIEIEAPRGLQRLDCIFDRTCELYGHAIVQRRYARKPHEFGVLYAEVQLAAARSIGIKVTKSDLKNAINEAEMFRSERLIEAAAERIRDKQRKTATKPTLTLMQGGAA